MKKLLSFLNGYFFTPISANGFGMMRIGWAAIVLVFMLLRIQDISFLYSSAGLVPQEMYGGVFRDNVRFTILDTFTSPSEVYAVYAILLIFTVLMLIGKWSRISTVVSVLLLWSFHERNIIPLGGGDTVLRTIGLLLIVAPELRALSVDRAMEQWQFWQKKRALLPPLTMSIWPWRLALWQLICIYLASGMDKLNGTMWKNGTAVASALHHEHFSRLPMGLMDLLSFTSPFVSLYTLLFEFTWILLLIPSSVYAKISFGRLSYNHVKRIILLFGVLFHGSISIFMQVGSFPFAMMCFYTGLLVAEDFEDIRKFFNKKRKGSIHVLFDGNCILCKRSVFILSLLDRLQRLDLVNFHDKTKRSAIAPEVQLADLDKAMHIKLPSGEYRKGFYAIRTLCRQMPACWPIAPLLYIPGIPPIGTYVYEKVAERRKKCTGDSCTHVPKKPKN